MRILIGVVLGAVVGLGGALAEPTNSTVSSVELFRDGALITRTADVTIQPGQTSVEILIPANLGWNTDSLQVVWVPEDGNERPPVMNAVVVSDTEASYRKSEYEERLDEIEAQRRSLRQELEQLLALENGVQGLIVRAGLADLDVASLSDTVAEIARVSAQIGEQILALETQQAALQAEFDSIKESVRSSGVSNRERIAIIDINASDRLKNGRVALRYVDRRAGWRPSYVADLLISDQKIELDYYASLFQLTGERWDDVLLVLSSAQIGSATSLPELRTWELIAFRSSGLASAISQGIESNRGLGMNDTPIHPILGIERNPTPTVDNSSSDVFRSGSMGNSLGRSSDQSGSFIEIGIDERISLETSGEEKEVLLDSYLLAAQPSRRSTPVFDEAAFVFAEFKNEATLPLLEGRGNLFIDGRFVGNITVPSLQPGQDTELGFGQDQRVVVTRDLIERRQGDRGFLRGRLRQERLYEISLANFHDEPVTVDVFDLLPVAQDEDVDVALLEGTTPITERDFEGERGVMRWQIQLPPNQEQTIQFGFEVIQSSDEAPYYLDFPSNLGAVN